MTGVYVTVEEAVARILKFDYVLDGVDLFETLYAFLQGAENEYEEAQLELLPEDELEEHRLRVSVCESRCEQAESLQKLLTQDPLLKFDSEQRLELDSVAYWAAMTFGVEIIDSIEETPSEAVAWKDVTIKIYKNYSIRYYFYKEKQKLSHYRSIGLMGERKVKPNKLGLILIGLSMNKKFPDAEELRGADRKAMTELRKSLQKLTELSSEPFYDYNKYDGYKPKFKLQDCRRISDERAKEKAIRVSFDDGIEYAPEASDFEREDDEAQSFLDENQ